MIKRIKVAELLIDRMAETEALREVNVDIHDWIADDRNVALDFNGDYGVFEYNSPGVYTGHYFFKSRGRTARDNAKTILKHFFEKFDVKVIRGLTPSDHLGALWMNRQLGFKDYGEVDTSVGKMRIVALSEQDFRNKE